MQSLHIILNALRSGFFSLYSLLNFQGAVKKLLSTPGVVTRQKKQDQTTAPRKNMWSKSKKARPDHSAPEKRVVTRQKNARPDHSAPEKHVVPKQEEKDKAVKNDFSFFHSPLFVDYLFLDSPLLSCSLFCFRIRQFLSSANQQHCIFV